MFANLLLFFCDDYQNQLLTCVGSNGLEGMSHLIRWGTDVWLLQHIKRLANIASFSEKHSSTVFIFLSIFSRSPFQISVYLNLASCMASHLRTPSPGPNYDVLKLKLI
jgi:hypothetical protein